LLSRKSVSLVKLAISPGRGPCPLYIYRTHVPGRLVQKKMFLVGRYGSRKAQACHGFGRSRVLDHRSFLFPFLNWTIVQTWHWANVYLRSERDRAARAPCHSLVPRPTFRKTVRHADAMSSLRRRALTQQRWNTSQNFSTFPQKTETKFY
jgi:hypothetical protein